MFLLKIFLVKVRFYVTERRQRFFAVMSASKNLIPLGVEYVKEIILRNHPTPKMK